MNSRINTSYPEILAEAGDIAQADQAYDDAQAPVDALHPQIDELIQEVMDRLCIAHRNEDGPSQR